MSFSDEGQPSSTLDGLQLDQVLGCASPLNELNFIVNLVQHTNRLYDLNFADFPYPLNSRFQMNQSSTMQRSSTSRRDSLFVPFSPGMLIGISCGEWFKALRENSFAVHPTCLIRAAEISMISAVTSAYRRYERVRYGSQVAATEIKPPLFILGHWRSGTTHLHNLMSLDDRFAYPNFYQVLFPTTFLCSEWILPRLLKPFLPKTRPFDNVFLAFDEPAEEECAICSTSRRSCSMSIVFPRREEHYDRYLTLRDVPENELREWQDALRTFLKKLTWKYGRPLILKSPHHTARIRLLLEMFPEARFLHIHRNPYAVFRSTQKMIAGWDGEYRLQKRDYDKLNDRIIRQYNEMYDAYFEEKKLIPAGRFFDVGYEDLEHDPLGQVRQIYEALDLPDYAHVEPKIREYVGTLADYKKNEHAKIDEDLRQLIAREWGRSFEAWNYPM